jgi:ABC-type transporter MlaC component
MVIDVTIEGVSLVSNYKDQFKEVLANGGPGLLIEKLREKNAAGATDDVG